MNRIKGRNGQFKIIVGDQTIGQYCVEDETEDLNRLLDITDIWIFLGLSTNCRKIHIVPKQHWEHMQHSQV